jgi:hypothetical protein
MTTILLNLREKTFKNLMIKSFFHYGEGSLSPPATAFLVAIILCSDGKPVDDWYILKIKIQPQVWVAVLLMLSNTMLNFAFAEGLTIRFQRQAGQGATVGAMLAAHSPMICPLHGRANEISSCKAFMTFTNRLQFSPRQQIFSSSGRI